MKAYQVVIKPKASILTPFQADTVFGHLCWAVAHHEGEVKLREFLESFNHGEPPFVISDGFPTGFLPKPLSADFEAAPEERKSVRKIDLVSVEEFDAIVKGNPITLTEADLPVHQSGVSHNTINRLSNTTLAEGGVYTLAETFTPSVSVYLKTDADYWRDKVLELFDQVSVTGYGRKKSIGKGWFAVEEMKEFEFPAPERANGFVALSNFCPAEKDPVDGVYRTFVKYGKLGEEFTFSGNPFKRPLMMIRSGSVFRTGEAPLEFYGRAVREIAPAKHEVIQYAFAFAVPIYLKSNFCFDNLSAGHSS